MTFPDNVILEVVYCHYIRKWIPLGRATKRCPSCGAVINGEGHKTRERKH